VARYVAARGGIPVIGCLEDADRAGKLAGELNQRYGVPAPVVRGDVLDERVRAALLGAAEQAGPLYGLVPLVGEPARVSIEEATERDFLDSYRVNFVGPLMLARDFAARVQGTDTSIVLISTMQAVGVFPGSTLYASPKAALIHAMRILARQWGGSGRIRVNAVAPGVTTSGMAGASVRSGKYDGFVSSDIITRFGAAADVARAIGLFLEEDNYITGQMVTVDGGLTARK
jgi:NAD(P)-dependent dehydrogenase (short-subunit alcohol dehydrogenase family)